VPKKVVGKVPSAAAPVKNRGTRRHIPSSESVEEPILIRGGQASILVDEAERVERTDEAVDLCGFLFKR